LTKNKNLSCYNKTRRAKMDNYCNNLKNAVDTYRKMLLDPDLVNPTHQQKIKIAKIAATIHNVFHVDVLAEILKQDIN
jgi:hypothetical protein